VSAYNGPVEINLAQLPIPDWGLTCPACHYPIRGLPTHRCPECGQTLVIEELIGPWTRLRDPRFTGHELPLPDFGLLCRACQRPLAGATDFTCPACGAAFDPETWRPRRTWFILDAELCGPLPVPGVQALLAAESVPHFPMLEMTVGEIYGGQSIMVNRLRVASEFYFEVRWLLAQARQELGAWRCARCGEDNPAHFELCWNCQAPR
jgi:predicted RNA-binding Zn-ribbon protein involved in translation (DUF1610 family)